jgi:hypothetical protein
MNKSKKIGKIKPLINNIVNSDDRLSIDPSFEMSEEVVYAAVLLENCEFKETFLNEEEIEKMYNSILKGKLRE